MFRVLATAFAALAGLAFGSFLNVCLTRWPQGESIVTPRSHCRNCNRALAWWENVPLASWLALRGRCRTCRAWIGWRYPLVEFAVGALWAYAVWRFPGLSTVFDSPKVALASALVVLIGQLLFYWMMVALAALDAEQLWLPDSLTLPGIALGIVFTLVRAYLDARSPMKDAFELPHTAVLHAALTTAMSILVAAGLILVIRGIYRLIRRREGMGLGDAKLMAMLAAWLGFSRTLLAFGLGVVIGAVAALVLLAIPPASKPEAHWSATKLPLGTFLCFGGIIASLWGGQIIAAYLHWAGFY
jgi:leader peptidase (prepilin peptidase) / N-methyltransferase